MSWDFGGVVEHGLPVYVKGHYWEHLTRTLPNPPHPIGAHGEGPRDIPAEALWYDGKRDLLLLKYPAIAGTGHGGLYDGLEDEPFFDAMREVDPALDYGCVFVPTSAIDLERQELPVDAYNRPIPLNVTGRYVLPREYPSNADVCNLAQWGMSALDISRALGISKAAVHMAISKLPHTIRILTARLHEKSAPNPVCAYPGCLKWTATPRSRYCPEHWREVRAQVGLKVLEQEDLLSDRRGRVRRGGRPSVQVTREASGQLEDYLPHLVDQTERHG